MEGQLFPTSTSSSSRFLFPDFKSKDLLSVANSTNSSTTSSGPGAQITGYSHSLLYDGEIRLPASGSIVRGPSVDDVGRRTYTASSDDDAVVVPDDSLLVNANVVAAGNQAANDRVTNDRHMSSFKPINGVRSEVRDKKPFFRPKYVN
jgi:hypothetical protein